ncbi:MAG: hypothetical protein ABIP48_15665, partial [Planctomycetota bacterium]
MRRHMFSVSLLAGGIVWAVLASSSRAADVTLTVEEPSGVGREAWPVTSGIPLAEGELKDPQAVALLDDGGRRRPLQTEALARWPDGSVRWLLVDFQVDLEPSRQKTFRLEYGADVRREPVPDPIRADLRADGVEIHTGPMRLVLTSAGFRLLDGVWLDANADGVFADNERVTAAEEAGIVLTTPDGKVFRADLAAARIELEQSGPLRVCVRIEGDHAGSDGKRFRYVVRLHAYRGLPLVRMFYTFVNDRAQEMMSQIDALDLVFTTAGTPAKEAVLDGAQGPGG